MRVFLDDVVCNVPAESVSQALASAGEIARGRGRTIVDVVVDGDRWSADRIDSPDSAHACVAREVRLTSAKPDQLVRQALDDASTAVTEIDRLQQVAAEMLQADRTAQAMQHLGEAMTMWGSVQQALVMSAEMASIDLAFAAQTVDMLARQLRNLRDAMEQRDHVALADTLLYDLPDVASAWRELLQETRERVK